MIVDRGRDWTMQQLEVDATNLIRQYFNRIGADLSVTIESRIDPELHGEVFYPETLSIFVSISGLPIEGHEEAVMELNFTKRPAVYSEYFRHVDVRIVSTLIKTIWRSIKLAEQESNQ